MNLQILFRFGALLFLALSLSCARASAPPHALESAGNISRAGAAPQNNSGQEGTKPPLPHPTGFVNDYANVFTPESKQQLESVLTVLRDRANIEFAVATVETTGGQPIFDYSLALAREWGIGPKDTSNGGGGLLLLVAIKDRQWWIQVGHSLEKDLPDEVCKELGDQSTDLYRQGKYAEGITKYVRALIARLEEVKGFKLG